MVGKTDPDTESHAQSHTFAAPHATSNTQTSTVNSFTRDLPLRRWYSHLVLLGRPVTMLCGAHRRPVRRDQP